MCCNLAYIKSKLQKLQEQVMLAMLAVMCLTGKTFSQTCSDLNIQWQADIPSTCNQMTMTMMHDANGLPYLYVANKEAGLKVYDISAITTPALVATVPTSLFDTLDVMNVSQDGNYLYLALGNSFTSPQKGGMAIVDVTNPVSPAVTDYYVVSNSGSGGGIVKVEGNYAYLGAMQSGLVILDITDKNNIQFVSQFIPDIAFPPVSNPDPNKYNARGMQVRNSIVYLCYDAGGIRIINCTDKNSPIETGRWCNPAMYTPFDHPKAYNNCVLDDTLLYVAVDYAGMEVLDVSDTSNITLLGWWNPYNAPNNNWFTSPVHANEMQYEQNCRRIFLSTGKSDMYVIDVSNPASPDSCNFYGGVSNNIGTWGIGLWQNEIYLSYICAAFPFPSNWTGVKILTYNLCSTAIEEHSAQNIAFVYPNPFQTLTTVKTNFDLNHATIVVYNPYGQEAFRMSQLTGSEFEIIRNQLSSGLYFFTINNQKTSVSGKFEVN